MTIEKLDGDLVAVSPEAMQAIADQSGADERAKFEAWFLKAHKRRADISLCSVSNEYSDFTAHVCWEAWQAASTQPAPQPAQPIAIAAHVFRGPHGYELSGRLPNDTPLNLGLNTLYTTPQPFPAPAVQAPIAWWNGLRKFDYQDGTEPAFSGAEDTNHDIPLYSWPNPCNAAPIVATVPSEPIAWMNPNEGFVRDAFIWSEDPYCSPSYNTPVYLSSPSTAAEQASDVRNAVLDEVQTILSGMYTESLKARVPVDEDEGGFNHGCLERALSLTDAAIKIRSLKSPEAKGNAPAEEKP